MVIRLAGAFIRAAFTVLLIAMPTLLLPTLSSPQSTQVVMLIAFFAGALVLVDYAARYPSVVEFRDAPPFNRIRFMSLFITVFLLTIIARCRTDPTPLAEFVAAIGALVGHMIDFPFSPVRLILSMFPADTDPSGIEAVRKSAGIAYLVSLVSLAIFVIFIHVRKWPRQGKFNIWVNLPIFEPTAGGDVTERLILGARINILLGFLLPFLIPLVVRSVTTLFDPMDVYSAQLLIWTVSAWAFIPASLFMRGIAMGRIAGMIREQRRMLRNRAVDTEDLAPV